MNKFVKILSLKNSDILSKSLISLALKIFGMVSGILINIYIARTLGEETLGIVALVNRTLLILVTITTFGMGSILIKEIAVLKHQKSSKSINSFVNLILRFNGINAIILAVIIFFFSEAITLRIFKDISLEFAVIFVALLLIPSTLTNGLVSGLIGLKKSNESNLLSQFLGNLLFGMSLVVLRLIGVSLDIQILLTSFLLSKVMVSVFSIILWRKSRPEGHIAELFSLVKFIKPASQLFVVSFSTVIVMNMDAIILGVFGNMRDVGLYTVASRLAIMMSIFLQAMNSVIAPRIAELYASKKLDELEKVTNSLTKILLGIGLFLVLLFCTCGEYILGLWGQDYKEMKLILIILSIGQLVNLVSGPVAQLLILTDHVAIQTKISVTFIFISLILSIVCIKMYGALGAAIAVSSALALENCVRMIAVRKYIGFWTFSLK